MARLMTETKPYSALQKKLGTVKGGSRKYHQICRAAAALIPQGPKTVEELAQHTANSLRATFSGEGGRLREQRFVSLLERGLVGHFDYVGRQGIETSFKMIEYEADVACTLPSGWLTIFRCSEPYTPS